MHNEINWQKGWLAALLIATLGLFVALDASAQSCHLRELDLCAASLLVLTQSPAGLATSEAEINKQCVHLRDADACLKNFTRACLTPMQRRLFTFASNTTFQVLDEYCTRASPLRTSYLKHAHCLNQLQKKEQRVCTRDLQAALEQFAALASTGSAPTASGAPGSAALALTGAGSAGKHFQAACCTYRRFEACFGSSLERRCGKEAIEFVGQLARRITSRLPETMCAHYKPDGALCRALLPKSGTPPRGAKSNSIVSRLLAASSAGL